MTNLLTPSDIRSATEIIIKTAWEIIPTEVNRSLVSEWAEENRILKEGNYQGPFSFEMTPYLKEIADCLSASSPVREVAIMKGTRMGATVGIIENWIGYSIDEDPAEMAYITASDELAGAQMELRIDSLINSSGIGDKIGVQEKRKNQKKTGDRTTRKVFPGGYLMGGGPRAPWIKRQFGFKKVGVDEIDEFPDDIDANGDPIYLIRGRTLGYEDTYKILWASSPRLKHNSKINALYKEGDQRKLFVPCKKCGHMQSLRWGNHKEKGGLKFEHDEDDRLICKINKDGKIIESSVYYECEKCGEHWTNADKDYFLPLGEWRPTKIARRPGMRSYHLPSFYSLMMTWESAAQTFLQIKHEGYPKAKFQTFVNTFWGEPFEDRGERPKIEALLTRERTYHVDTLPEDAKVLFVTIGADIQGDRIECEVVGWGKDAESWSISYHVLHGDTLDLESACWEALRHLIKKKHAGFQAILTGIDSGYRTDIVHSFCDTFADGVHPIKGSENLNKDKDYIKLFEVGGHSHARIDINTDLMKQEIYRYLSKGFPESGNAPKGYCHFPAEYSREHFNRLTAENRVAEVNKHGVKKYKWDTGGRRNEQLDTRVYALAMVYAYRLSIETYLRDEEEIEENQILTWAEFWEYIS